LTPHAFGVLRAPLTRRLRPEPVVEAS